ncbi:MAG TPA: hypothetical protein VJ964_01820 [Balneolaceae bacterium]|nr:hypothetical protein [Balneolaceae bacterium]
MKNRLFSYRYLLLPIFGGTLLLFVPLLGDFHIESAILVSLVGCFWAGIRSCSNSGKNDFFDALRIAGYLFLVGLPLLMHSLLSGCFSINGLGYWLLFPLPSIYFGYSIGRLFKIWGIPFRRTLTVGILLAVSVGIFLYEFFHFPQVYFFNHVWGGWPGPIYDEVIEVNGATVFFRILTILWAVFLWHLPTIKSDKFSKWIIAFSAILLLFSYTQLTNFGIITPRSYLQKVLGGHKTTQHFNLYYDKRLYDQHDIQLLAKEHEFYYHQISQKLNLPKRDSTDKIESYLYGQAWQKKKLVGAKFTSYVPVWLHQDQLHIAKQQLDGSLEHELVHVMAKRFGNPLLHASWSMGLTEGLAVAIAGGSSSSSTIDQIVVSEKPYPSAKQLQQAFSPLGFYGGRSGVNYTTSGSFVHYLMNNYPITDLKRAYRTGNIAQAYPSGWKTLTEGWHRHLDSVSVDSIDKKIASHIFGIKSLFEQPCPHVISAFAQAWDTYHFYRADRDSARALKTLNHALMLSDSLPPIKAEWSYRHLLAGDAKAVRKVATDQDTTVDLQLLYADAYAMTNDLKQAENHIKKAQQLYAEHPDSLKAPALATRMDRKQWEIYRKLTYQDELPDSSTFGEAYYRTKIRSLRKALKQEKWRKVDLYSRQLLTLPLHVRYFDDYQDLIHHLAFARDFTMARNWIDKVAQLPLRSRYHQRLQQEQKWLNFLKSQE